MRPHRSQGSQVMKRPAMRSPRVSMAKAALLEEAGCQGAQKAWVEHLHVYLRLVASIIIVLGQWC